MVRLGVITGLGRNARESYSRERLDKQGLELDDIDLGSAPCLIGQDKMSLDVADHRARTVASSKDLAGALANNRRAAF